jgi:flavodoxin
MKVLVAYVSQSGNTKKVADAIFQEIQADKEIKELGEVSDLEGYDLAFIGYPIMQFGPAKPAQAFLEENSSGKKIALFMTHAVPDGAPPVEAYIAKSKEAAAGADVAGIFECQGELAANLIEMLLKSDDPEMRAFGEMGPSTKGQPDAARLEKAGAFAKEIMEKVT